MERPLRLRTITYFLSDASEEGIAAGAAFLQAAQQMYEDEGYVVQTTRIAAPQRHASQPLPELTASIKELEGWAAGRRVKFVNIGPLLDPEAFDKVPHILRDTRHVSCSVALPRRLTPKMALGAAKCILELASMTGGRFPFCGTNIKDHRLSPLQ
ncbi:unnamed protein product [Ostreobium quekettii]|uniref:Uncharacterized protein n=1 Tax=Ostreobium quekettii TaxID=121088 RepID=A0A8S1JFX4_9CHLO|nr:unnamed protein product [Ostreobium quekettii]